MADITRVTVVYNDEEITQSFESPVTAGQILGNSIIKGSLGFGDNVVLQDSDGAEFASGDVISNGDTVYVARRAAQKAA